MKQAYLDSSAFFKIFFGEESETSQHMEKIIELAKRGTLLLVISEWVLNEGIWAAVKKHMDGRIKERKDASEIIHLMADTVEDGIEKGYVVSYAINEKVVLTSRVLIEEAHMHPSDALHVVVAVVSRCDYFITADKDITDRIRYAGLSIMPVYIFDETQVLKFFADL